MHCYLGPHIKPEGWSNWNKTENDKTARYAEYRNYGPAANSEKRVAWSTQLTDAEATAINLKKYLESWIKK
jgi:pectinesterase